MSYNEELQNNNDELQEILNAVNELPEAGESVTDAVRYTEQTLTDEQKEQARENIDALGENDLRDTVFQIVDDDVKGDIVQSIIAELQGLPVFGVVDENKKIKMTTLLPNGTYKLGYDNEDGTFTEIASFVVGGGVVEIINLLETALTPNDITTVFDGKGYKSGYYASASTPYYNTDSAFFCSGLMPIPASKTFYVKGCTINTSLSHTRFGLMKQDGGLVNTAVIGNWNGTFTVEELGTQYYSITIDTNNSTLGAMIPYYFYFSASGTGEGVIVSATPIE